MASFGIIILAMNTLADDPYKYCLFILSLLAFPLQIMANWSLTFADNFNGNSLNDAKWNRSYYYSPSIINDEQQFYSPDALSVKNGYLVITASETSANGLPYTSGAVTTLDKFSQQYGYFEIRAILPAGSGLWPAFWMLDQNISNYPPEIDIFEFLGHKMNIVHQGLIYRDANNDVGSDRLSMDWLQSLADNNWHTYGLEWSPGELIFYVDGYETGRITRSEVPDVPMYVILNMAVGGGWPGIPNENTRLAKTMKIDYVRAYEKDPSGPYATIPSWNTPVPNTPDPVVANSRFYLGATELSAETVNPGDTLTVTTSVKCTTASSSTAVQVKLIPINSSNVIVKKAFLNQSFSPEVYKNYTASLVIPAGTAAGDYRIQIEVNDQSNNYAYLGGNNQVRTLAVTQTAKKIFTVSNIKSLTVKEGQGGTIRFDVTPSKSANGHRIQPSLVNRDEQVAAFYNSSPINFVAGQTVAMTWSIPTDLPAGNYRLVVQIFDANWNRVQADNWNDGYHFSERVLYVRGLVSRWKFDESSGQTAADTLGVSDGDRKGNAQWSPNNKKVGAGSIKLIDGVGDWIEIPDEAEYSGSCMSVSCWFKAELFDGQPRALFSKRESEGVDSSMSVVFGSSQKLQIYINDSEFFDTGLTVPKNQWHHLVVVFCGWHSTNNLKVYLNGVLSYQATTVSDKINDTYSPIYVGNLDPGVSTSFKGRIDDLRIYDTALTQADISTIMSETE